MGGGGGGGGANMSGVSYIPETRSQLRKFPEYKGKKKKINKWSEDGQVETEEAENGNGKLKRKTEAEKLKIGSGRQKYKRY